MVGRLLVVILLSWVSVAQAQLPSWPGIPDGGTVPSAQPATVQSVLANINRECVQTYVFHNSCAFGTLSILAYWAPTHFCEVTGKTGVPVVQGQTPLQIAQGIMPAPNPLISGAGASNSTGDAQTNRHFKEVRCYAMPLTLSQTTCTVCDGNSSSDFTINYVSDIDEQWRTQTAVNIPGVTGSGLPITDFGVWGPIAPRTGFVIHGSEVVAAAHASARAMHIASQPVETPPNTGVRQIFSPAPPPTCFQVAHPRMSQCLPPGASPIYFETFRLEPEGKYVFIYFSLKVCCTDSGTAESCRALHGSGSQNFCALGVGPLGFVPGAIPFQ